MGQGIQDSGSETHLSKLTFLLPAFARTVRKSDQRVPYSEMGERTIVIIGDVCSV